MPVGALPLCVCLGTCAVPRCGEGGDEGGVYGQLGALEQWKAIGNDFNAAAVHAVHGWKVEV